MSNRKEQRNRNKQRLIEYLAEHPCVDCGDEDVRALTFDHLRDKKSTVSDLVNKGYGWPRVMEEIAKTVVRCAACHVKIEEQRANTPRFRYWFENQRPKLLGNLLDKKGKNGK